MKMIANPLGWGGRDRPATFVSPYQFRRAVAAERIRATRRAIPFCLVEITIDAPSAGMAFAAGAARSRVTRRGDRRTIAGVLHRYTRLTDQKCEIAAGHFAWLLTDTPQMGGRIAAARIEDLITARGVRVQIQLDVHDPDGFQQNAEADDLSPPSMFAHRDDSISFPTSSNTREHRIDGNLAVMEQPRTEIATTPMSIAVSDMRLDPSHRSHLHVGLIDLSTPTLHRSQLSSMTKRGIDVVGSVVGLVLLSPVILAAMAAIRFCDGGSPMFKQTREGRGEKPFTIYKLRTMTVDAELQQDRLRALSHRDGPAFKIDHDPRVTKIGNFLRKTCLDELPQLLNVLRGEMSLVGPRPLPWHESRACSRWHRRRLEVRPGMTCYWQINKKSVTHFDDWMRLDLLYLHRGNLIEDLRLIVRTFAVPLRGRGGE